ncbi:hypothetical protein, partial [uncultured Succinivibrio sp.]|uniref:hypothetical protein n=1 Tax=uncultured Succinivibrio sp. TaxID=540749 RepID=UPI0025FCCD48
IVKKFFKIYSLSWQSSASDLSLRFPLCYFFDEKLSFSKDYVKDHDILYTKWERENLNQKNQ